MGPVQQHINNNNQSTIQANHVSVDSDQCLQSFWEIEEISTNQQQLTPEEEAAEKHFKETTQRLESGRYEVRLPFKNSIINIGESKNTALKRLHAMERKFRQNRQIEKDYKAFMHEYIQLGHMQVIHKASQQFKCFLPHHAVIKQNSTTFKIRVVFDASSISSNGLSLNDNLIVGPMVQRDLFDILISFRLYAIAYVADVEKMYRQVSMNEDDRFMQCILWRDNEYEEVKEYTLNTVTYGTAAASFLATRTLNQIAADNTSLHPIAVKAIKENFYVDDFMHSSENLTQAIKIKDEVHTALFQAGFPLRKWSSNSSSFLKTIPEENRAMSLDTEIQHTSTVATLGLMWNTKGDFFKYSSRHQLDHYSCECRLELHGFSDASELAYAAAVYTKVYPPNNKPFTYLLVAKTRVAPVKQVSLPRLELCAAHLLVKLMSRVRASLGMDNILMHAWTDSTIVLCWISDHPRRWKTFIANRTAQIIDVMPAQQWRHINSSSNPADLATRGISTNELANSELWWHGPRELHQEIPKTQTFDKAAVSYDMEERQQVITNTVAIKESSYIDRYSNFSKLIRITALILRFAHNCQNKKGLVGFLSTNELRRAHNIIMKLSQNLSLSPEIKLLTSNKQLPANHSLSTMAPFIDNDGIVRVGGRLSQAEIGYDQKTKNGNMKRPISKLCPLFQDS